MARITHFRLAAAVASALCLLIAPLVIFAPGVRPLDAKLADYAGGHIAGPTCNGTLPTDTVIGMAATKDDGGYWVANNQGLVVACGDAQNFGGLDSALNSPIVGIAATPDGGGYYLVASDGGVFTFGDALFQGSTGALRLNKPVVGMAVDQATGGYWLVASDGGIFSFNALFQGSTGAMILNKPIVGMAPDAATGGYWLVASDGGIFSFNAPFKGSMGAVALNKPIVGMATDTATGGYWLVAADGGIFSFGGAPFYGSTGSILLNRPIVGMEANAAGTGYRFVASDGGIFDFGSSAFFGSPGPSVTTLPGTAPPSTAPPTSTPPTTAPPTTAPPTTTPPTTTPTTTTAPPAPALTINGTLNDPANCDGAGTPGCTWYISFSVTGLPPNTTFTFGMTINGTPLYAGHPSFVSDANGDFSDPDFSGDIVSAGTTSPSLIIYDETATIVLTLNGQSEGSPNLSGTTTLTAPGAPVPVVTVTMTDSAIGCGSEIDPATGTVEPCPLDIGFSATGFGPDDVFPITVSGPDVSTDGSPTTINFDGMGDASLEEVAETAYPPALGTYTITIDGVSGTYVITAANQ